jgi:tetratricopeptide (TPR) repeat protein
MANWGLRDDVFVTKLGQVKPEVQKLIEYASGYLDLKMFDEALREADAAVALAPADEHALAIKSAVLWQQNRLSEAEPFVARLAEIKPDESGIWINLAYIRRRTQSLDAAVATLQRAFVANPSDPLAHFNMACYRAVQHRTTEALELLRNALSLDPKLKSLAQAEHDFDEIRRLPEFQRLLRAIGQDKK